MVYNINIIKVKETTLKIPNKLNFWRLINMEKRIFEILLEKAGFESDEPNIYEYDDCDVRLVADLNSNKFISYTKCVKDKCEFKIFDKNDMDNILDIIEYRC